MNFFSRFWGSTFGAFKSVLNFMLPILQSSVGKIIDAGLPIALPIVTELEKGKLPNEAKYSAAFAQLGEALKKEGYSAGINTLDLIIKMAVARLKTTTTP